MGGFLLPRIICANASRLMENKLVVTSRAFEDEAVIPIQYTGRGEDISPEVRLSTIGNSPDGATDAHKFDCLVHRWRENVQNSRIAAVHSVESWPHVYCKDAGAGGALRRNACNILGAYDGWRKYCG